MGETEFHLEMAVIEMVVAQFGTATDLSLWIFVERNSGCDSSHIGFALGQWSEPKVLIRTALS